MDYIEEKPKKKAVVCQYCGGSSPNCPFCQYEEKERVYVAGAQAAAGSLWVVPAQQ